MFEYVGGEWFSDLLTLREKKLSWLSVTLSSMARPFVYLDLWSLVVLMLKSMADKGQGSFPVDSAVQENSWVLVVNNWHCLLAWGYIITTFSSLHWLHSQPLSYGCCILSLRESRTVQSVTSCCLCPPDCICSFLLYYLIQVEHRSLARNAWAFLCSWLSLSPSSDHLHGVWVRKGKSADECLSSGFHLLHIVKKSLQLEGRRHPTASSLFL